MLCNWPSDCFEGLPPRRVANRLARRVRAAATLPADGPLDVDVLCRSGGFTLVRQRLGAARGGYEGRLAPLRSGFQITVDSEPRGGWTAVPSASRKALSVHRERFRVAHEVGHTFFYERRPGRMPERRLPDSRAQERWCDEFARMLLVPPPTARALPATASSVTRLQEQFDVSLQVALRSLAAAHRCQAALWFWELGRDGEPGNLVRQWATVPRRVPVKPWREHSLVDEALQASDEVAGPMPQLRRERAAPHAATALALPERRQVIVVAR